MKKIFNRVLVSQKEINEIGRDAYGRGLNDGMKLASVGGLSAIHRLKRLDTWDKDLKKEIIDILEIIYGQREEFIRGVSKFSGALLVDDANKPADIHSQTMRERVIRYYEETLLSRLNGSDVPIVNIQQRLHIEDLSGILMPRLPMP